MINWIVKIEIIINKLHLLCVRNEEFEIISKILFDIRMSKFIMHHVYIINETFINLIILLFILLHSVSMKLNGLG